MPIGISRARLAVVLLCAASFACNADRPADTAAGSPPARPETAPAGAAPRAPGELDRSVLPIPDPAVTTITELDARKATAPPPFQVKAPAGAPNILIVLIDDMGFGHPSAFGGPVQMPTAERL